jgi:imidazole glycerol-phosphate synthase subunit HisH
MVKIAIIDYGAGNLFSVASAIKRISSADFFISSDAAKITTATHIILPGVGAFADCMNGIKSKAGLLEALNKEVLVNKKPFLGICVGMQMLFDYGNEHGRYAGLGWIKGEVVALKPKSLKVPHMGWNELQITQNHELLNGVNDGDDAYFVHSYHALTNDSNVIATCDYGEQINAIIAQQNIMGTQFHPEKSHKAGEKILRNFISMTVN